MYNIFVYSPHLQHLLPSLPTPTPLTFWYDLHRCDWAAITDKPPKKLPRHIPMHLRKKMKEKPPPKYFEVEPPSGILLPGQTFDIRIKFMPSEEVHVHSVS